VAYKRDSHQINSSVKAGEPANGSEARTSQIAQLLRKVDDCLKEEHPKNGLNLVSRSKLDSPWVTNARGVCLLRLGEKEQATELFRSLVLPFGGLTLREDAPTVFKLNYATALLACNNVEACRDVLGEIDDPENPVVQRLLAAIQRWKASLSLWEKLRWYTGDQPDRPVTFDFPLGALE